MSDNTQNVSGTVLSAMQNDISQIKLLLSDELRYRSRLGKAQGTGSTIFSTTAGAYINTSLSQMIGDKQYCSLAILLISGSATIPTNVRLEIATEQGAMPLTLNMTSGGNYIQVNNIRVNKIFTDSTSLGSATMYINWITYDQPSGPPSIT
jgi:hypothetical protein